jgi:glycine/D-amino acid oxidase-like deaminating enzyme
VSTAAVVGAGVFGASTARELTRRGWDVTLVEQYMPGTVRSASGGDTRLLRFGHGDADWYTRLAVRARRLWIDLQDETRERIWEPVGVAWFESGDGDFTERSERTLAQLGLAAERLTPEEARRLYPSLGGDDLRSVLFEPDAGVLHARRATQLLAAGIPSETRRATPADAPRADVVVWACGAWLAQTFPGLIELRITRRDVFFFGVDGSWANTPGFADYDSAFYGHGDIAGLGMKIASDGPGEDIDPDTLERLPLPESEPIAREYAARRFPALADAPVIGARVCQYALTGDTHFLVAPHPDRADWWLIGGGSGHGFKHGPALGEYVADCIERKREPEPFHALGPRVGHAGLRTASDDA